MTDLIVLQGDTHIPDQHKKAIDSFLGFLADVKPASVLQVGDLYDMLSVARWSTGTRDEDGRKLQHELDCGREFFKLMRTAYSGPYRFLPGNHDDRLRTYTRTKGLGLHGLADLTIAKLGGFAEFNVEEVRQPFAVAPGVDAIHGIKLGARAGMSVDKELSRRKNSVVMGHCHRQAIVYRQMEGSERFGVEVGHFMDQRKATYLEHGLADWSLGFAVLYVDGRDVQPVLVKMRDDGSFMFEGRRFRA